MSAACPHIIRIYGVSTFLYFLFFSSAPCGTAPSRTFQGQHREWSAKFADGDDTEQDDLWPWQQNDEEALSRIVSIERLP